MTSSRFAFTHSLETTASPDAVWELYRDVTSWPTWDAAAEQVTLDGPFAEGSAGSLKLHGQPPLAFRLTEVSPRRVFCDETAVPTGVVRFRHVLDPLDDGRLRLTHAVEIEASEEIAQALGAKISAGVPATMATLARLAEERSS